MGFGVDWGEGVSGLMRMEVEEVSEVVVLLLGCM